MAIASATPAIASQLNSRAQAALVIGSAAAMACAAHFEVRVQPVPFTLQTFVLFTGSMLLGSRLATLTQLLYLAVGGAGLGVFAGGVGGASYFVGPTGGYLVAMLGAGYLLGKLAERNWCDTYWKSLGAVSIGSAIVFAVGVAWLSRFIGIQHALVSGFVLFILSEVAKLVASAGLVHSVSKRLG